MRVCVIVFLLFCSVCSDLSCLPQIIEEDASLVEIGPRFVLNLIKIFQGSFGGPTLFENPHFQSPNAVRGSSASRLRYSAALGEGKLQQYLFITIYMSSLLLLSPLLLLLHTHTQTLLSCSWIFYFLFFLHCPSCTLCSSSVMIFRFFFFRPRKIIGTLFHPIIGHSRSLF